MSAAATDQYECGVVVLAPVRIAAGLLSGTATPQRKQTQKTANQQSSDKLLHALFELPAIEGKLSVLISTAFGRRRREKRALDTRPRQQVLAKSENKLMSTSAMTCIDLWQLQTIEHLKQEKRV